MALLDFPPLPPPLDFPEVEELVLDFWVEWLALDVILWAAVLPADLTLSAELFACFPMFPVPVVVPVLPVVVPVPVVAPAPAPAPVPAPLPAPVFGCPAAPQPASRRALSRPAEAGARMRRNCKRFTSTPSLS